MNILFRESVFVYLLSANKCSAKQYNRKIYDIHLVPYDRRPKCFTTMLFIEVAGRSRTTKTAGRLVVGAQKHRSGLPGRKIRSGQVPSRQSPKSKEHRKRWNGHNKLNVLALSLSGAAAFMLWLDQLVSDAVQVSFASLKPVYVEYSNIEHF